MLDVDHCVGFKMEVANVEMQIVVAVSQIMFCRDLTECLNADEGNILEAIRDAEKTCFEVEHTQCVYLHSQAYIQITISY